MLHLFLYSAMSRPLDAIGRAIGSGISKYKNVRRRSKTHQWSAAGEPARRYEPTLQAHHGTLRANPRDGARKKPPPVATQITVGVASRRFELSVICVILNTLASSETNSNSKSWKILIFR